MRVILCSDYLARRQGAEESRAMQWSRAASEIEYRRTGLWKLLAIVGIHSSSERLQRAQKRAMRLTASNAAREAVKWYKGQHGEHVLTASLSAQLDDRYLLLRNVQPRQPFHIGGDIDAILVGPHGVTVFEVKALTGEFMVEGDKWWWRSHSRARWQPAYADPSGQALRNAERVRKILRAAGAGRVRVQAAVAVASPEMRVVQLRSPRPFVYFACRPDAAIEQIVGRTPTTGQQKSAVMDWLAGVLLDVQAPREPTPPPSVGPVPR